MSQSAKKTPSKPADDPQTQTVWLFAAAIAAWNAGVNPEGPLEAKWGADYDEEIEVAQFLLLRAERGAAAYDELAEVDASEGEEEFTKPKGFKSWAQTSRDLFARLLDFDTSKLQLDQVVRWSPYHLRLITKPGDKDKLYDERVEQEVAKGIKESIQEYGGNYDPLKVAVPTTGAHRGEVVVVDGRCRTRATIEGNAEVLKRWWWDLQDKLRRDGPAAAAAMPPPKLVCSLQCIVKPMKDAALLKNLSNSAGARTPETVLQEARCCWELEDLGNNAPRIGKLRGHNEQTVRNYLSLRKLIEDFLGAIKDGTVTVKTGYRLARETKTRQTEAWKAIKKSEEEAIKAEKKRAGYESQMFADELKKKRDAAVNAWLDGAPLQGALPGVVVPKVPPAVKAKTYDRLTELRTHLAKMPASPEVDSFRSFIAAVLGDEGELAKLPPALRAGVSGAWGDYTVAQREAWHAAGVWDPETIDRMNTWTRAEMEAARAADADDEDGVDPFDDILPEDAARPWSGGGTLGAAVEAGKLTVPAFHQLLRQEQLALPASNEPTRRELQELAGVAPRRARKAKAQADADPMAPWERGGVYDKREVAKLREAGFTAEDMQRLLRSQDTPGVETPAGILYTTGKRTIDELKAELLGAAEPAAISATDAAQVDDQVGEVVEPPAPGPWEAVGVFEDRLVAELVAAGLAPEDLREVEELQLPNGHVKAMLGVHFTHGRVSVEDLQLRKGRRAVAELGAPRNAGAPAVDPPATMDTAATPASEPTDPALAVRCGVCHAAAGEPCESPAGLGSHASRVQAAAKKAARGKRQAPPRPEARA